MYDKVCSAVLFSKISGSRKHSIKLSTAHASTTCWAKFELCLDSLDIYHKSQAGASLTEGSNSSRHWT